MGLRAKLAGIFVPLLVVAVLAVSVAEVDRTLEVMIADLRDSSTILVRQTFEQIRLALEHPCAGDPIECLRHDRGLAVSLASAQAFGKGVVYARLETTDGELIAGTPREAGDTSSEAEARPLRELEASFARRGPLASIGTFSGNRIYEVSDGIDISRTTGAVIKIGLSTSLLAAEIRREIAHVFVAATVVLLLSLGAAMLAGALLLHPVAAITAGMAELAAGGATRNLEVGGGDELSALALKFNELSQRISSDRAQWEDERGQFMGIFHSISDAVLLLDAEGRLLFSNQESQARLDLPAGGVAEGRLLEVLLGRQHPLVNLIGTARATGSDLRDVAIGLGVGPDDERATFLVSVFRLGREKSRIGQLIIVRDLDSVQNLESVVEHSGRLARLSGLISGVAHQIRSPLNAMTLELELLRQDARNSGIIEERVRSVRAEMDHLGQAIEALMRFMRPERLQLMETDVNDLVAEIGRSIVNPLVEVRCALDPSRPALIADRAVLGEALRNVAQNGVEAMAEGGVLTLTSRRAADDVEIAIADTGMGISSEDLEHIFQLYFTTKEDGTGVGLSLALRAVDLHGGRMNVDSKVGKGTVVTINLPLKNGASMAATSK